MIDKPHYGKGRTMYKFTDPQFAYKNYLLSPPLVPHYRLWQNQPRPKHIKQMELGYCYYNAYKLDITDFTNTLTYVEGIATDPWHEFLQHGWVVDQRGNVIDPTWGYHPDRQYYGVPMKTDWIWKAKEHNKRQYGATLRFAGELDGIDFVDTVFLSNYDALHPEALIQPARYSVETYRGTCEPTKPITERITK